MNTDKHITRTGTDRRGANNNYGRRGGNFRESEAHCSCGWSSTYNGQTYAESQQEIREHLKEMGAYNTQAEQTIYANLSQAITDRGTLDGIIDSSGKTKAVVKRCLKSLMERGHVIETSGVYTRTDKWFSWND